jgi:hypothetical protein
LPARTDPYFAARHASAVHPVERQRLDRERQALVEALEDLDPRAGRWLEERRIVLEQARDLHERLWPKLPHHRTRRPPCPGSVPLPPLVDDPDGLRGMELRSVCMAMLERHGPLRLVELHGLVHLYGFKVESASPVKALADAMGREARAGRAVRLERGVYGVAEPSRDRRPDGLPDPPDPVLRLASNRWWHGWPEPGMPGSTLRRRFHSAAHDRAEQGDQGRSPDGGERVGEAGPDGDQVPGGARDGGAWASGAAASGAGKDGAGDARADGRRAGPPRAGPPRAGPPRAGPPRAYGLDAIEGLSEEGYERVKRALDQRGAPWPAPPDG